jgi:hypothetical protein
MFFFYVSATFYPSVYIGWLFPGTELLSYSGFEMFVCGVYVVTQHANMISAENNQMCVRQTLLQCHMALLCL